MVKRTVILLLLSLVFMQAAGAATPTGDVPTPLMHEPAKLPSDTLRTLHSEPSERNLRLYDSIRIKAQRRKFTKLLYNIFFTADRRTRRNLTVDEGEALLRYDGCTIGNISIQRDLVFGHRHTLAARLGNGVHVLTAESTIRRDLLISEGDKFDAGTLMRNRQLLQSRPYISEASIEVMPDSTDTTRVDILVRTRDSWSIGVDGEWRSRRRTSVELFDVNLLGTGNRLSISTNFLRPSFGYGGNVVAYEIPNVLGTFFQARASAGRSFAESELTFDLHHDFLEPSDFDAGASFERLHSDFSLGMPDTIVSARLRRWHVWGGRSIFLPAIRSSIYATAHYTHTKFGARPETAPQANPAFHSFDMLLAGIGLYRENFGSASYVDGMGVDEYFAIGYKAEIVGGRRWNEFTKDIYIGTTLKAGSFLDRGYLAGSVSLGSFIDPHTGAFTQSATSIDAGWFSNIHRVRYSLIRYFVSVNYMAGWNRFDGYKEWIGFNRNTANVRMLNRHGLFGTNRLTMNAQAVIFTPLQPLGFRFAVVAFTDFGLLGYDPNIFRNNFYNSLGIGLRIRNERLIFGTINLRVGFAWGRKGILPSRWFESSSISPIHQTRYLPSRPDIITFE